MKVRIKNIAKHYGASQVLQDISLTADSGDRVAVLGSNGAGKTTLLEILAGVIKADKGTVNYDDWVASKCWRELRSAIGFIPQELALFPKLTLKEQLAFWSDISSELISAEKVQQLIRLTGLEEQINKKLEHLSGGMKRKLNLVLSLLHDPRLIIADEPTVGIDIQSKLEIMQFMKTVCSKGKTLFFSSHSIEEVKMLATKVAYLDEGRLLFYGTLQEVVSLSKDSSFSSAPGWQAFTHLLLSSSSLEQVHAFKKSP